MRLVKLDWLRQKDRLIPLGLYVLAGVLAVLTVSKVAGYFISAARAEGLVERAATSIKSGGGDVDRLLAKARDAAESLKRRNVFVPPPPRKHPVQAVAGILGEEALINGRWYKAGDMVADAKIVAVEPTRVKIEWQGQQKYFAPIASQGSGGSGRPGRGSFGPRGPGMVTGSGGPPGGPGRPDFRNMSPEARAKMFEELARARRERFESMSEEERQRFREAMRRRFGGRGPGGPGGPGGFGGRDGRFGDRGFGGRGR